MRRLTVGALLLSMVVWLPGPALAGPFTSVVAVGDSLTANGTFGFLAPPPYAGGRASDGPVWVEHLAAKFGVPLVDFATIGARTPDVEFLTLLVPAIGAGALTVVWAGANDLINCRNPTGPIGCDFLGARDDAAVIAAAVQNIKDIIMALDAKGADTFLVLNLPDIGATAEPAEFTAFTPADLTARSTGFNAALDPALAALDALPGIDILKFDVFALFNTVIGNPGAFGFTNVTDPCLHIVPLSFLVAAGAPCADPGGHLFWDGIHPSAAAHRLLGDLAAHSIPMPATLALLAAAAAVHVIRSRSRRG